MTTTRTEQIAAQMRAEASDTHELDAYTVLRIDVVSIAETYRSEAERMAEIRATLAARELVLAEIRGQR